MTTQTSLQIATDLIKTTNAVLDDSRNRVQILLERVEMNLTDISGQLLVAQDIAEDGDADLMPVLAHISALASTISTNTEADPRIAKIFDDISLSTAIIYNVESGEPVEDGEEFDIDYAYDLLVRTRSKIDLFE